MEQNKGETARTFDAPEVKLHFLDYWRIIRIRKTVILAVFLLVSLSTTLVTLILPPTYSSTVRIQVEKDTPDVRAFGEGSYVPAYDPYWQQTEFEKIKSKSVLYKVIRSRNLNTKWAVKYQASGPLSDEVAFIYLKNMLDVRQSRGTSLIEIGVQNEDKDLASYLANDIAEAYKENRRERRKELTEAGIKVLETQWIEQDRKCTNKQAEVNELKNKLKIPDLEAQSPYSGSTLEPETLRALERLRIESSSRLASFETLYHELSNLPPAELKHAITVTYPDPLLSAYLENESTTMQKLADMLVTYTDATPEVQRIRSTLQAVTNQVNQRVSGFLDGLRAKVKAQRAEFIQLSNEVVLARDSGIKESNERRPYFTAKRDLESLLVMREKLQTQIIAQQIEAQIPKSSTVEVVDKAEPGLRPYKPNKPLNISLGIIFGLLIGVGLAFFIEYLDTSVKTIDDVERALQAPVLGVIPQNVGLLHEEGPDSPHAEAYRVLRTNVLFSRKDAKLNTITIVSGGAGEGKSTTLFNLAIVFAQNGQRVLMVDSDLRRPSLHKYLRVSNVMGLTSYLLKQNTLEEVIQTTSVPTLDFLPSGKLPSSSLGILSSAQMKEMIRDLKRRYDFIFFDSPPIMGVSDASILASEVDMVLQVIQYRRYPQPMTIRAKQMVEKIGGNLLGVVLNNINLAQDENYYYYSGYYYDYYSKSYDEYQPGKDKGKDDGAGKPDKVEVKSKY
jgi:polysaccharide biosynthesis transport protein